MVTIELITEEGPALQLVRQFFKEYEQALGENLCFQSFGDELENPLKKYGAPHGAILLAYHDGQPCGCIALQPLAEEGVCEMKRLYVQPAHRQYGIGKILVEKIIAIAKEKGYETMVLDTLQRMQAAIRLYESAGFVHTSAYYDNPIADVVYMKRELK
jgi:putative acetyltransferase